MCRSEKAWSLFCVTCSFRLLRGSGEAQRQVKLMYSHAFPSKLGNANFLGQQTHIVCLFCVCFVSVSVIVTVAVVVLSGT